MGLVKWMLGVFIIGLLIISCDPEGQEGFIMGLFGQANAAKPEQDSMAHDIEMQLAQLRNQTYNFEKRVARLEGQLPEDNYSHCLQLLSQLKAQHHKLKDEASEVIGYNKKDWPVMREALREKVNTTRRDIEKTTLALKNTLQKHEKHKFQALGVQLNF